MIGLDCLTPQVAWDRLEEFPNLARVAGESRGLLRSSHPPITVPAWSSMTTGRNPGVLGFTGFRNLRRGTYDDLWLATGEHVREPRVWDALGEQGRRVVVHGVPQTWPPRPVRGSLVSCFLTPDLASNLTWPPRLQDDLLRAVPGYRVDVEGFRTRDKERLLDDLREGTEARFDAFERLLRRERWDFAMGVEIGTDRVAHGFWRYHDPAHRKHPGSDHPLRGALLDYYRLVDARVGRLLDLLGDDDVAVVVSDHGAKAMEGAINVNDWLRAEGHLVLREEPDGVTRFSPDLVDWGRTRAWALGGYYARVFVNLKGREPRGVVHPRDYEGYVEELSEGLAAIPDERGRPIPTRVHRPGDVYAGPHVKDCPDLLAYFGDLSWRAHQSVGHDELWSFETEIGPDDAVHDWHGVFAVAGAGLPRRLGVVDILDVAPTLYDLAGARPPPGLEGRSLLDGCR